HQLELALEAVVHARHHVGDDGTYGTRHRHVAYTAGRHRRRDTVLNLDFDAVRQAEVQLAVLALDANIATADVTFDTARQRDRRFSYSGHSLVPAVACVGYETLQSTSPPWPAARAARSVITPCEVETMEIPKPPTTSVIPFSPRYTRMPGVVTRSMATITPRPWNSISTTR